FSKKPIWKRFIAIFAGAAFNIIFALILAIIFLTIFGERLPIVEEVGTGTPADEAGIIVGDNITRINGEGIDFGPEATINVDNLGRSGAKSINVTFLRDGKEYNYDIPCYYDSETKTYRIGVAFQKESTQFGFFEALGLSFKWVIFIIKEMFAFLGGLIFGTQSVADVMGPVGTIAVIGDVIKYGLESIMRLASLLCINLGIVNLLPLPALDGGRLALLVVEGIRRKPISPQKEGYIHLAGFILLLILMALLTYQDIARLITQ
ncbi:MAG: M50 family metallopeptidase, partial [Bacillota bacterium]|nr:M50 family metallopeptidase [Bacillota bacterium]